MTTVKDILALLEGIAPLETQEEWDNAGLLAGDPQAQVTRVLVSLDLCMEVLEEAKSLGAELIVTHHPILFRGRKNLREDDPEGKLLAELVRARVAMIAMHTNFDNAEDGVNQALCDKLGIRESETLESGMHIGNIDPVTLADFRKHVEKTLGGVVRAYGRAGKVIRRVAVLGGAGGGYASIALEAGADAFVTGEMAYHAGLDCAAAGMAALEAGHAATEHPAVHVLREGLQKAINAVQYNVETFESAHRPFL